MRCRDERVPSPVCADAKIAVASLASRGGRPSREAAELIRDRILDAATDLFLSQGYGATTVEAVAQQLSMSKRTLYHRFRDKAELFDAVVRRILDRLRPADMTHLFVGASLEEVLLRLAKLALAAALTPQAMALQRLILTEATRFPELAAITAGEGTRRGAIEGIAGLLRHHVDGLSPAAAGFAAEQFLQMVVSLPQRRALLLGAPMTDGERQAWVEECVTLFLHGVVGVGRASRSGGEA